jgi:hypothetical protein
MYRKDQYGSICPPQYCYELPDQSEQVVWYDVVVGRLKFGLVSKHKITYLGTKAIELREP